MLQPSKSASNVRLRKTHVCVNCDGEFSYLLARDVDVRGRSPQDAAILAREAAMEAADHAVDRHVCPHCGVVQPEMLADDVQPRYLLGLGLGLGTLLFVLAMVATDRLSIYVASQISFFLLAASAGPYLWGAMHDPNRTPHLNIPQARADIDAGVLFEGDHQSAVGPLQSHGRLVKPLLRSPEVYRGWALGLGASAVAAVLAPVLLATFGGWYVNSALQPAVVGPGETARFRFDADPIQSLGGMWNGQAYAEVLNARDLDALGYGAVAKTKESDWSGAATAGSVGHAANGMYIDVTLPDLPELAGKTLDLSLEVRSVFPIRTDPDKPLEERERNFHQDVAVMLAPAGSGTWYTRSFWFGHLFSLSAWVGAFGALFLGCRDLRAARSRTMVSPEDD